MIDNNLADVVISKIALITAAILGGLIDWFHQVRYNGRKPKILDLVLHLVSAAFFGWISGVFITSLGYDGSAVYAANGLGGAMGMRLIDNINLFVRHGKK